LLNTIIANFLIIKAGTSAIKNACIQDENQIDKKCSTNPILITRIIKDKIALIPNAIMPTKINGSHL
jgi:hypothetical protein